MGTIQRLEKCGEWTELGTSIGCEAEDGQVDHRGRSTCVQEYRRPTQTGAGHSPVGCGGTK